MIAISVDLSLTYCIKRTRQIDETISKLTHPTTQITEFIVSQPGWAIRFLLISTRTTVAAHEWLLALSAPMFVGALVIGWLIIHS
jgi:hypothetical protein